MYEVRRARARIAQGLLPHHRGRFLAAARIIVGPPMSISSSTARTRTDRALTPPGRSPRCRTAPCRRGGTASARSARMPPCTLGCSVTTRCPRIAGTPVISAMSVTGRPASSIALAVPPLDTEVTTQLGGGRRANSTMPVLSYTDNSALTAPNPFRQWILIVPTYNSRSTSLMRSCNVSTVSPGATATGVLGEDRTVVDVGGGDVHGAAGDLHPGRERRIPPRATP